MEFEVEKKEKMVLVKNFWAPADDAEWLAKFEAKAGHAETMRHLLTTARRVIEKPKKGAVKNDKATGRGVAIRKDAQYGLELSEWPNHPDVGLFNDWIKAKKKAGGSISQRAINTIGKELHKIVAMGITVDQALEQAEAGAWKGLKAEYFNGPQSLNGRATLSQAFESFDF